MGLPAAREAGEKAVAAVKAAKKLEAIGDLLDHLDTVVQLDALVPDADVDPIPGPTPRFLAEVTEGMTDDHSPTSASDALHSAGATTTTTTTTASKKRSRGCWGQEVDSLLGGVEGVTVEEKAAAEEDEERGRRRRERSLANARRDTPRAAKSSPGSRSVSSSFVDREEARRARWNTRVLALTCTLVPSRRARVDVRRPRVLHSSETLVNYASLPRRFPVTVCFDFRLRVARFLT